MYTAVFKCFTFPKSVTLEFLNGHNFSYLPIIFCCRRSHICNYPVYLACWSTLHCLQKLLPAWDTKYFSIPYLNSKSGDRNLYLGQPTERLECCKFCFASFSPKWKKWELYNFFPKALYSARNMVGKRWVKILYHKLFYCSECGFFFNWTFA